MKSSCIHSAQRRHRYPREPPPRPSALEDSTALFHGGAPNRLRACPLHNRLRPVYTDREALESVVARKLLGCQCAERHHVLHDSIYHPDRHRIGRDAHHGVLEVAYEADHKTRLVLHDGADTSVSHRHHHQVNIFVLIF